MTTEKPKSKAETQEQENYKPKTKRRIISMIVSYSIIIVSLGGWETLCFQNIPLLLFLIFICGTTSGIGEYCIRKYGRKRFKTGLAGMGYTLLFLGIVMFMMYFFVPVARISKETTYLTEPRTPDGKAIDIRRAIAEKFLPDCAPRDNGFRHVVEKFGFDSVMTGVDENQRDTVRQKLYQALKLDVDTEPELKFEPVRDFFERVFEQFSENDRNNGKDEEEIKSLRAADWDLFRGFYDLPWPEQYRDHMEQWLAENEAAIDCFSDAVRQKEYFVPCFQESTGYYVLEPYESCDYFHREMADAMMLRILDSIVRGNREKTFDDIEILARLAKKRLDHLQSSYASQDFVTESYFRESVMNLFRHAEPDHAMLDRLQSICEENRGRVSFSDMVFLWRMIGMHWLYYVASGDIFLHEDFLDPKEDISQIGLFSCRICFAGMRYFGWNPAFAQFQARYDQWEKIVNQPYSRKLLEELQSLNEEQSPIDDVGFGDTFIDYMKYALRKGVMQLYPEFMGLLVGDFFLRTSQDHFIRSCFQREAKSRQAELVFALERYALDHGGEYPETMEPLLDGYLAALPTDPYTDGEPFHYKRLENESEKGYILYSVGYNGEDDGGLFGSKCDPETGEETKGDDPNTEIMKKIVITE